MSRTVRTGARPWSGRIACLIVGVIATAGWTACLTSFYEGSVFQVVGLYALAVISAVMVLAGRDLLPLWRPLLRPIIAGLAVGLAMAGSTLIGYPVAVSLFPDLRPPVQELFAAFAAPPGPLRQLHWLLVIVAAEELLWRGLWPIVVRVEDRPWLGGALVVLIYAIGQAGSGSPLVVLLAVPCGAVWTALRVRARSLWAPFFTHLVWDLIVLVGFPLE